MPKNKLKYYSIKLSLYIYISLRYNKMYELKIKPTEFFDSVKMKSVKRKSDTYKIFIESLQWMIDEEYIAPYDDCFIISEYTLNENRKFIINNDKFKNIKSSYTKVYFEDMKNITDNKSTSISSNNAKVPKLIYVYMFIRSYMRDRKKGESVMDNPMYSESTIEYMSKLMGASYPTISALVKILTNDLKVLVCKKPKAANIGNDMYIKLGTIYTINTPDSENDLMYGVVAARKRKSEWYKNNISKFHSGL